MTTTPLLNSNNEMGIAELSAGNDCFALHVNLAERNGCASVLL